MDDLQTNRTYSLLLNEISISDRKVDSSWNNLRFWITIAITAGLATFTLKDINFWIATIISGYSWIMLGELIIRITRLTVIRDAFYVMLDNPKFDLVTMEKVERKTYDSLIQLSLWRRRTVSVYGGIMAHHKNKDVKELVNKFERQLEL